MNSVLRQWSAIGIKAFRSRFGIARKTVLPRAGLHLCSCCGRWHAQWTGTRLVDSEVELRGRRGARMVYEQRRVYEDSCAICATLSRRVEIARVEH